MKGWTELCSDMNWEDYHGMWAKKAKDGSYYVLCWTNMYDAMGEGDCKRDGHPQYSCEVKRLCLRETPENAVMSALQTCGYVFRRRNNSESLLLGEPVILNEHSGDVVADGLHVPLCILECCIQHGLGAPLETFTGDRRPLNVRAAARRYAERCMKDAVLLAERLDRPVNAIGSTAREYGSGDTDAALRRYQQGIGEPDTTKDIMLKMLGAGPRLEEPRVQFGTLHPDGSLIARSSLRQSSMQKCPHLIMDPTHYRADESCMCDDAEHRKVMTKKWGYQEKDFKGIPLRGSP